MRPRLLGPDGRVLNPPTIWECAIGDVSDAPAGALLPVIEALSRQNDLLQDARWAGEPWKPSGRILDAKGRPYLRVVR